MLNQCQFIGNLGADPEIRSMQSGDEVANLSIAVTEKWKKDGQPQERTEWVRAVVFGGLVNVCKNYLKKGSKVYISGQMQTRQWEANGEKKYTTEIVLRGFDSKLVMLDSKPTDQRSEGYTPSSEGMAGGGVDPLEDEIPFMKLPTEIL